MGRRCYEKATTRSVIIMLVPWNNHLGLLQSKSVLLQTPWMTTLRTKTQSFSEHLPVLVNIKKTIQKPQKYTQFLDILYFGY